MKPRSCMMFVLAWLLSASVARADERVVRLSSLEWPPYAGAGVDQQGASVAVLRAAATAMGYTLEVKFFPWNRAVAVVQDPDSGFLGYFPEYHSTDVATRFRLSAPIGTGPLGFVEATAAPVSWQSLADLQGKTIGTVSGYVNTAAFDAMTASGQLRVDAVFEDAINIRKVAAGRIPLAVIDRNVLQHLLAHDAALSAARGRVQFNARSLEDKALHVAFQRSAAGEEAARVIDAGLEQIDAAVISARFFEQQ